MLKFLPFSPILLLLQKFHHQFRVVFILLLAGKGSRHERECLNHLTLEDGQEYPDTVYTQGHGVYGGCESGLG